MVRDVHTTRNTTAKSLRATTVRTILTHGRTPATTAGPTIPDIGMHKQ